MGIDKYNAECRGIVSRYCAEWEHIVTRLGRWIDFKNDYKTMEPWYVVYSTPPNVMLRTFTYFPDL